LAPPPYNPPLLSLDRTVINSVAFRYHYFGSIVKVLDGRATVVQTRCHGLIAFLENKYGLD
jgi:hypothetical protein